MSKDFYKILGVEKNASPEELKKAFRRLAHEHHPDKGGDAQKFKDINEAYQVLSDAEKRTKYDQFGSAAFEQGGTDGGGFGGFGGFDPSGFSVNMDDMGDLSDILGGMFGFGGKGGGGRKRGQDIEVDVTMDFIESVFGVTKTIKLYKHDACTSCKGSGSASGSKTISCSKCNGQGRTQRMERTIFGSIQRAVLCADCHGTGKVPETPCKTCKGFGIEKRNTDVQIHIPAGISDGEALKVTGAGEHSGVGGSAGDLYVRVRVKSHPDFIRDGNDVRSTVRIPYTLFALGGYIDVKTVDGPVSLKIPEYTQPGTVFKLREKGVPYLNSRGRGDHLVEVQVSVERKLSREQRSALEDLKEQGL
jgi:molecular chaperone DnaJ